MGRRSALQLANALRHTELLAQPERFSLKCVNVIQSKPDLAALMVSVRVGERVLSGEPLQLRAELRVGDVIHIVEVVLPATIRHQSGEELHGSMIATDSLCISTSDSVNFWKSFEDRLEHVHASNKALFFSLLTDETLHSLGPEY